MGHAFLIQAEHWAVPSRRMAIAMSEESADRQALAWTNELIADVQPGSGFEMFDPDCPVPSPLSADGYWEDGLRALAIALLAKDCRSELDDGPPSRAVLDDLLDDRTEELPGVWIERVEIVDEPEPAAAACPSNHWNDGSDKCADCGADLN
jgi:hypothetical protein